MNFHEVCNIYGYNKSTLGNLKEGVKLEKYAYGILENWACGCDKRVNLIGITDIIINKYILFHMIRKSIIAKTVQP